MNYTITSTLDTYLGNKLEPFDINFTVTGPASDTLTYEVYINNNLLITSNLTLDSQITVNIPQNSIDLLNIGEHIISIKILDNNAIDNTKEFIFDKLYDNLLIETNTIETNEMANRILVNTIYSELEFMNAQYYTTILNVVIDEPRTFNLNIHKYDNSPMKIDWGDDTEDRYLFKDSETSPTHTFNIPGTYNILIKSYYRSFYFNNFALGDPSEGGTIGDENTYRENNECIRNITFGENYGDAIGDWALCGCINLNSITIPDYITSIGDYAFADCYLITSFIIPNTVTHIGGYAFASCTSLMSIDIPEGITEVPTHCFWNCDDLVTVHIPDSATSIGKFAFYDCYSLTTINIHDNITIIKDEAFRYCNALTNISIGNGCVTIDKFAFCECTNLETVVLGNSVVNILDNAFADCHKLSSINLPNTVRTLERYVFAECRLLTSINLPEGITNIPYYGFYKSGLQTVILPSTITSISSCAFQKSSLNSINIPEGVTNIGRYAFSETALWAITIPPGVTTISYGIFDGCGNDDDHLIVNCETYYVKLEGWDTNWDTTDGVVSYVDVIWYTGRSIEYTWEEISEISASGRASDYFRPGDYKTITINGTVGRASYNGSYRVFILGIDHNSEIEGNGITFGTFKNNNNIDISLHDRYFGNTYTNGSKYFNMNHSGLSNLGGWQSCDMRYDILGSVDVNDAQNASPTTATNPVANTLMAALPADLRAVMKPITKYTDNYGNISNNDITKVTSTIDYLPLLSEYEVFGSITYSNRGEQTYQQQYDYYRLGNSVLKKKYSDSNLSVTWWLRSPGTGGNIRFLAHYELDRVTSSSSFYSYAISPIFLV